MKDLQNCDVFSVLYIPMSMLHCAPTEFVFSKSGEETKCEKFVLSSEQSTASFLVDTNHSLFVYDHHKNLDLSEMNTLTRLDYLSAFSQKKKGGKMDQFHSMPSLNNVFSSNHHHILQGTSELDLLINNQRLHDESKAGILSQLLQELQSK